MTTMAEIFLKIRKKGTEEFSSGGRYPDWVSEGKHWSSLSGVRRHLALFRTPEHKDYRQRSRKPDGYDEAEVVEYRCVEDKNHGAVGDLT